ncbi:MAG: aspartyl protease family protein [Asticcacaulis sp.]
MRHLFGLEAGALSRRHVLAAGAAASVFVLPGLGRGAAAQQVTAGTPQPAQPAPDQDTANLRARTDADNHLTVEVTLNSRPLRFVVDTAAERSVIADDVAALLGLPPGPTIIVDGIGRRVVAPSAQVRELSFGPFTMTNLTLPVLPRTTLIADGYLGLDAISNSRVSFDFKNHQLTIEQPRSAAKPPEPGQESTRVRMKAWAGHLRFAECIVDGVSALAFIDTGAQLSVGSNALLDELKLRSRQMREARNVPELSLTGVTGGEISGPLLPVYRIRLQELSFTDGTLVIADVPDFDVFGARNRPAVLIGMDYLRQFAKVAIDYRAREVRFDLSLAPPQPRPGVEVGPANA